MADSESVTAKNEAIKAAYKKAHIAQIIGVLAFVFFIVGLTLISYGGYYYSFYYNSYISGDSTEIIVGCVFCVISIILVVVSGSLYKKAQHILPKERRSNYYVIRTYQPYDQDQQPTVAYTSPAPQQYGYSAAPAQYTPMQPAEGTYPSQFNAPPAYTVNDTAENSQEIQQQANQTNENKN